MTRLRFIGDIHGDYKSYLKLLEGVPYSLQVGDLGFNYRPLKWVDITRHRAIGGNHDNYQRDDPNYFAKQPIFLGDFGLHDVPGLHPVFYVRGAWSIDHAWRQTEQQRSGIASWWPEEELDQEQLDRATQAYVEAKPQIVVTHECPYSIVQYVTDPAFCLNFGYPAGTIETRTNKALQGMLDTHRPKLWVFGHYHTRQLINVNNTNFVCLDMARGQPSRMKNCYFDL